MADIEDSESVVAGAMNSVVISVGLITSAVATSPVSAS